MGDDIVQRVCVTCSQAKPRSEFYARRATCKRCVVSRMLVMQRLRRLEIGDEAWRADQARRKRKSRAKQARA